MKKRKLTRELILKIVELKKTRTWDEVSQELSKEVEGGISASACKYWGRRLKRAGHEIIKQKAFEPIDLTINN